MLHASLALLALSLSSGADGGDWPRWRGPLATGAAPEARPPLRWSAEENVAWRTPLPGHGKSTPIVHGERIYLLAAVPAGAPTPEQLAARPEVEGGRGGPPDEVLAFHVLAVDRRKGTLLWDTTVTERLPISGTHATNGYASSSPVTDGETVYVSFGSYGVYALDAANGDVRWTYELGPQRTRRGFGEGASPALSGDTLVVVADQEDPSFVLALDRRTGEVRWKRERDEATTWTTPLIVTGGGATQVVVNGTNAVRSYDLATGELLWSCGGQTANPIPTPVAQGDLLVATSGFRGSACVALSLAGRGDLTGSTEHVLWTHSGGTPYVPSPALVDGRLYFLSGNDGILSCLDVATGEVLVDRQRLEIGSVYASPLAAGGRIYVVDREGTTVVLEHGDGLEVVARNDLGDPIDASPVAVGEALYLRSNGALYAIGKP